MLKSLALSVIFAASLPLPAQTFDVASIRPSAQSVDFERDGETKVVPGTLSMRDVTVSTCIKWAYEVEQAQIVPKKDMDSVHYDIVAKTADGITSEQMRVMLRNLLTERFGLVFHHEKRELSAYALIRSPKGVKIKPSAPQDGEIFRRNSATGMIAKNMTLADFAQYMSGPIGAPVVDETHLDGKYDFNIDFTPFVDLDKTQDQLPAAVAVLNATFEGELGLRLVPRRATVDVLVVDRVTAPTEN
jgi:uncharacterized protein (TIGR03435 family)